MERFVKFDAGKVCVSRQELMLDGASLLIRMNLFRLAKILTTLCKEEARDMNGL